MVANGAEFREWLGGQPNDARVAIAFRGAMRLLPLATLTNAVGWVEPLALAMFRACLTAGTAAARPSSEIETSAESATRSVERFYRGEIVRTATSAAMGAVRLASGSSADFAHVSFSTTYPDTALSLGQKMIEEPIRLEPDLAAVIQPMREAPNNALTLGRDPSSPWAFWSRWYAAAIAGDPLPWELQEQVALIPDAVWEAGPDAVAEEIARIEAEFALRQRIDAFEADQASLEDRRLAIGGNNPPEKIDDPETSEQLVVVWESIAGLKEELEADVPDAGRVATLIDRLAAAIRAILAWSGRKADLVVDTTIKWGIPAACGGYFLVNPSKAEAVLKAAQDWLPFLTP